MKKILLFIALIATTISVSAQSKKELEAELLKNLKQTSYPIAAGSDAVILSEAIDAGIGLGYCPPGRKKALNLARLTITRQVKILNNDGCRYATVSFTSSEHDNMTNDIVSKRYITATAYNLEGDKIVKTQLSARDIKQTRSDNGVVKFEFTIPNVKSGSIIEYSYSVQDYAYDTDHYTVALQGELPKLRSIVYFHNAGFNNLAHQNIYTKQGKHDIATLQWEDYLRFRNGLNSGKYSVINTYSNGRVEMPEANHGYCFIAHNLPAVINNTENNEISAIVVVKGAKSK